jgi:hypothetical protein
MLKYRIPNLSRRPPSLVLFVTGNSFKSLQVNTLTFRQQPRSPKPLYQLRLRIYTKQKYINIYYFHPVVCIVGGTKVTVNTTDINVLIFYIVRYFGACVTYTRV